MIFHRISVILLLGDGLVPGSSLLEPRRNPNAVLIAELPAPAESHLGESSANPTLGLLHVCPLE